MPTPRLVKDINPGSASASPIQLTAVGNTLYFTADDGNNGFQLWRSNGTVASTKPVIPGRKFVASPSNLTALGTTLFFSADDGFTGIELWKSTGTASGTVPVTDIVPGSDSSNPSFFRAVDNILYFTTEIGRIYIRRSLWRTDGTSAGTYLLVGEYGTQDVDEPSYAPAGNIFYFALRNGGIDIWRSDGTKAILISRVSGASHLATLGNLLLFAGGYSTSERTELWKSDGTQTGTSILVDINPGNKDSYPADLTRVENTIFFTANDGRSGRELWKTSGTPATTLRVADIRVGSESSNPRDLTPVRDTLYFVAYDDTFGTELWKSDGTTAGTVRVADIAKGTFSSTPEELTAVGNMLYFTADDGTTGRELWRTDGTAAGTVRVTDLRTGEFSSNPANLTAVGRNIYFTADNGSNGQELYFLDLTPPLLGSITVDGSRLVLGFSEPIQFLSSVADRFSVTVAGISRSVLATTAGPTSSDLLLTLDGPAPTSSQSVRVQYTDLTRNDDVLGVVQDRAGNDLASINPPGRAADTFRSAASVAALAATTTNLVLTGKNPINGTGNNLANTITGNGAANSLNGGAAADRLIGGGGNDTLTGGFGADIFRLDAALSSSNNRDTITDFNPFQGDRIEVENGVYKGLTRTGSLTPTAFRSGRSFNSAAQRILYNPATGHLSYDSNGNASGGVSVLIAVLTTKPTLTPSLFIVT